MDRKGLVVCLGIFVALIVDGMDLQMLSLALSSIGEEFKLSPEARGWLSTFTLIGMGIGGITAGWLSDRVGRIRVTRWGVVIFTLCTGLIALCQTYWQIAAMRLISGFGIAAVYSIGTLLAAEYVPTRIRTRALGTLMSGWSIGYVVAALLSSYVIPNYGWRPLFFCAIAPGIVSLLLLRGLSDPASFFAARAARQQAAAAARGDVFAQIWADPSLRRTFVFWSLTAIALQFGYYGANTWLPSYLATDLGIKLQSVGWYVAGTYTMAVFGKIITGYLGDRFGRRATWIGCGLLTAIYLPMLIYFATPATVPYLLLVFGLLYGAPFAVHSTYVSESFPHSVRGTAVAASYNIGRVGSTVSPILIGGAAEDYSIGLGIALLGVSYAICGLVPGFFIREKMYDPRAVEVPAPAAPPVHAARVAGL